MKKTKIAVAIALALSLSFSLAAPAFAKNFESNGSAGFGSVEDKDNKPVDPNKPDPEEEDNNKRPDPPVTGDKGKLTLDVIPHLNFGTDLDTYEKEHNYPQKISSTKLGPKGGYDAPFIQVTEKRGPGERKGWEIQATCGEFYKVTGPTTVDNTIKLKGAAVKFGEGRANAVNSGPVAVATAGNMEADGKATSVAKLFKASKVEEDYSYGTWVSRLFDAALEAEGTYNQAYAKAKDDATIQLYVPGGQATPGNSYKAVMTWNLIDSI